MPIQSAEHGFISTIFVILISSGIMILSLILSQAAASYADGVFRKEERIQSRLNMEACLDVATIMFAKDYFLSGRIDIGDLGCVADIARLSVDSATISATSSLSGVTASGSRLLSVTSSSVRAVSEEID